MKVTHMLSMGGNEVPYRTQANARQPWQTHKGALQPAARVSIQFLDSARALS